jgi:very-short-patch-repair endonuclease
MERGRRPEMESGYIDEVMMDDESGSPARRLWGRDASRDLRRRATPTERRLWDVLRHHRLDGKQFRRQHPIGPYIVDFACPQDRLVIEIDGEIHATQREYDADRDTYLDSLGYIVLRFSTDRVLCNLEDVLSEIRVAGSPPSPSQWGGVGGGAHLAREEVR